MLKLSDVPARAFARDSSSRRDDVMAAHAISDASSPMARTNPASRSFSVVFIVVGSRPGSYLAGSRFTRRTAFPAPRWLERRLRRLCGNPPRGLVLVLVLDFTRVFEEEDEDENEEDDTFWCFSHGL